MNATLQHVLPVIVSMVLIVVVAVVQAYSKTIAAITATMPMGIPLALWIIYAANDGDRSEIEQFAGSLFVGVGATLVFTVVVWLATRAGLGLVSTLAVGYAAWAVVLGAQYAIRSVL
jgi:hypothetical protein